ncbi:hypothetical protein QT995_17050 [Microcoleus sp. S36b_A3]
MGSFSQQQTPLNKKGEELAIALIAPIAFTQTHITQGIEKAIKAS